MKSRIFPKGRSFHAERSDFFPEANLPVINVGSICEAYEDPHAMTNTHIFFDHEIVHSKGMKLGDILQRLVNSMVVLHEIFNKSLTEQDAHKIVEYELANQILHDNSKNLQEAFLVYHMKRAYDWEMLDGIHKVIRESLYDNAHEMIRNALANKRVASYHDMMQRIDTNLKTPGISPIILQAALDIDVVWNPQQIITRHPMADVEWRFETIIDSLEKFGDKGYRDRISKDNVVRYISDLTGIRPGRKQFDKSILQYLEQITYIPSEIVVSKEKSDFFDMVDLSTKTDRDERAWIFHPVVRTICCAFEGDGDYWLNPNSRYVPPTVLAFWFDHFRNWLLKECIISRDSIDEKLDSFPQIAAVEKKSVEYRKAKQTQESLEIDKVENYAILRKMMEQN